MFLQMVPKYNTVYDIKTDTETCHDKYGRYIGGYAYELECDFCHKIFVANVPKKYCSKDCSMKANTEKRRMQKAQLRVKKCLTCGEEFHPTRSDALFCSNRCRQKTHRDKLSVVPHSGEVPERILYVVPFEETVKKTIQKLKDLGVKQVFDFQPHGGVNEDVSKEAWKLSVQVENFKYIHLPWLYVPFNEGDWIGRAERDEEKAENTTLLYLYGILEHVKMYLKTSEKRSVSAVVLYGVDLKDKRLLTKVSSEFLKKLNLWDQVVTLTT